jgi:hypothetical protein
VPFHLSFLACTFRIYLCILLCSNLSPSYQSIPPSHSSEQAVTTRRVSRRTNNDRPRSAGPAYWPFASALAGHSPVAGTSGRPSPSPPWTNNGKVVYNFRYISFFTFRSSYCSTLHTAPFKQTTLPRSEYSLWANFKLELSGKATTTAFASRSSRCSSSQVMMMVSGKAVHRPARTQLTNKFPVSGSAGPVLVR